MKYKRIIHILTDGRQKYSTHNGEIEMWSDADISAMEKNRARLGDAAYTRDFSRYDVEAKLLRSRFPKAKIIRVVGYRVEDHDMPIDSNVIF
ncbi:MAG: hypothetical protein SNH18_10405 [Rikenellaceae bacterium]